MAGRSSPTPPIPNAVEALYWGWSTRATGNPSGNEGPRTPHETPPHPQDQPNGRTLHRHPTGPACGGNRAMPPRPAWHSADLAAARTAPPRRTHRSGDAVSASRTAGDAGPECPTTALPPPIEFFISVRENRSRVSQADTAPGGRPKGRPCCFHRVGREICSEKWARTDLRGTRQVGRVSRWRYPDGRHTSRRSTARTPTGPKFSLEPTTGAKGGPASPFLGHLVRPPALHDGGAATTGPIWKTPQGQAVRPRRRQLPDADKAKLQGGTAPEWQTTGGFVWCGANGGSGPPPPKMAWERGPAGHHPTSSTQGVNPGETS